MTDLRRLGRSGPTVSAAGLGCNNFGRPGTITLSPDATTAVVHAALDAGITLFDTADVYGAQPGVSETLLGQALGGRRDEVIVATKFGMDAKGANGPDFGARGSRPYIRASVEASLRRLEMEWIDLYQMHEPDPGTPIEDTLLALDELVAEGKVRFIGHSNFSARQLTEASGASAASAASDARDAGASDRRTSFVSAQNHYSLLHRGPELDLLPAAAEHGVGVLPFFPLANGLLTGKYTRDDNPAGTRLGNIKPDMHRDAPWDALEQLAAFAGERDLSMLQVAFGWLLAQPAVGSVIAGATRPEQVAANAEAASCVLTPDDLAAIDAIFPPPDAAG